MKNNTYSIFKQKKDTEEDVSNETETQKWSLPSYGYEPFILSFIMIAVVCVFATILYIVSTRSHLWTPPSDIFKELFSWTFTALIIPHSILFFISLFAALLILPLKGIQYAFWIMKQSVGPIVVSFLALEAAVFAMMGMFINAANKEMIIIKEELGMSLLTNQFWGVSIYSITFVLWTGYRVGWKAYRNLGAKTMEQRFNDYQDKLLIKNSGQFWEKYIETSYDKISGRDGSKPRNGFLYFFILTPICTFLTFSIGNDAGNYDLYLPLAIVFLSTCIFTLMAIVKSRDTTKKKVEPKLIPVRDKNSIDTYDPELSSISRW